MECSLEPTLAGVADRAVTDGAHLYAFRLSNGVTSGFLSAEDAGYEMGRQTAE